MENKLCPFTTEVEDGETVFTGGDVTFADFCEAFTDWDILESYIGYSDYDAGLDPDDIPGGAIVHSFYVRGHIAQVTFKENPLPVLKRDVSYDEDGLSIWTGGNVTWAEFEATFRDDYDVITFLEGEGEIDIEDPDSIPGDTLVTAFYVHAHEAQVKFERNPVYHATLLFIDTRYNGYGPSQCGETLTVGELIALLKKYDEDLPVFLRNYGGYMYGNISESSIVKADTDTDE